MGYRNGESIPMTTLTGTSVAAAHVAGAVANLFSWGIVEGHNISMSEASIKAFLIRGAKRNPALSYPNREWGYGALDLYETFLRLRKAR
nr:S8 family serine peptidase [[Clostridium] symbiosum]